MNRCSSEVLLLIFKYLHLKQKLECMLVCRAWANVLRNDQLYETIELSDESTQGTIKNHLSFFMKKMEDRESLGRKCKRLLINDRSTHMVSANALATSFPNLKYFNFRCNLSESNTFDPDPFQGWRASLQVLHEKNRDNNFISGILTTGVFKSLTTLTVIPAYDQNDPYSSKFISSLKNIPYLTTLDTRFEGPSIDYLEELHKNAPSLISLTLHYTFYKRKNVLKSSNILPAKNMKKIRLKNFPPTARFQGLYLLYMKMKYIYLDELTYVEGGRHYYRKKILSISGWNDLLSTLGPRLTKLTIGGDIASEDYVDPILQHLNHLEDLTLNVNMNIILVTKILKSGTFHGLRKLSLRRFPKINFQLSDLKGLANLNEISLRFSGNVLSNYLIKLEQIVEELPKNIETLILEDARVSAFQKTITGHSNLVNIRLYNSSFQGENISNFLTLHFPKLNSLVLENCKLNEALDLPYHQLHYIEYTPYRKNGSCLSILPHDYVHFTQLQITTPGKIYYFKAPNRKNDYNSVRNKRITNDSDHGLQQVLKASEKDPDLKYFRIKCLSVETVYFDDYLLLL